MEMTVVQFIETWYENYIQKVKTGGRSRITSLMFQSCLAQSKLLYNHTDTRIKLVTDGTDREEE